MKRTKNITKEKLIELYIEQDLTQEEIGKIFECDRKNIAYYLKKFNIKKDKNEIFKFKVEIEDIIGYIKEGKTILEISDIINVGRGAISNCVKRNGMSDLVYINQHKRQSQMMKVNNPVEKGSTRPELKEKLKKVYEDKFKERINYLMLNTFEECKDFKTYAKKARALAYRDRRDIRDNYVIDHIYSIRDGYTNKVPLPIISHKNNLRLCSVEENSKKGSESLISLEELYRVCK